ncbi:MAG: hypothetical protein COA36_15535 [Desulfotalea sp.]|nr:MAG: hypothetical protein COA36_15535 [Desulfotalea sp.]
MENIIIPQADVIPVAWGWFQALLLLTFPIHLLAMNAMLGGLAIGIVQHLRGGTVEKKLAHRIAVALPLVIAFVVNFGVAPYLFLQVIYGQFLYSSSVLMGTFWILIIPILIIGYYGAYLYDFKFNSLGIFGPFIAIIVFCLLLVIGFFFSNNMLLMSLPERFTDYFSQKNGTMLVYDNVTFWPRYLHMMCGALAVGGLFVGVLGRFRKAADIELADHCERLGLNVFLVFTLVNVGLGLWYLFSLPHSQLMLFMGGNIGATALLVVALFTVIGALVMAFKRKFWLSFFLGVTLVVFMTFLRSWLRTDYLSDYFSLDQLQLVPQYSPFIFFLVTLVAGIICIAWLVKKSADAFSTP